MFTFVDVQVEIYKALNFNFRQDALAHKPTRRNLRPPSSGQYENRDSVFIVTKGSETHNVNQENIFLVPLL